MLFGVDISHHNSAPGSPFPMHKASQEHVDFVIAKASQGYRAPGVLTRQYNFKDADFDAHRVAARKAGLVFGAYHWLMRTCELTGTGTEQAEFFVRSLATGPDRTIDEGVKAADGLLLAVDVERTTFGEADAGDMNGLPGWNVLRRFVVRFHELLPGHPLLIYGNAGSGAALVDHDVAALPDTYLWYAHWNDHDGPIRDVDPATIVTWHPGLAGFEEATIVQFTSEADFAKRGRVDADAFRGTRAELEALTHATTIAPVPDPDRKERRRLRREGYRAFMGATHAAVQVLTLPTGATPAAAAQATAYRQGVEAARVDLLEQLDGGPPRDPEDLL